MDSSAITHPNEQQTRDMFGLQDYKYLGYQNGWKEPSEYTECRSKKHKLHDKQHNHRGSNNTVRCEECKIFYKYDCSD